MRKMSMLFWRYNNISRSNQSNQIYISRNLDLSKLQVSLFKKLVYFTNSFWSSLSIQEGGLFKRVVLLCEYGTYWRNFCQLTVRVQQNIFEKPLIEDGSLHLYVSFLPFASKLDNYLRLKSLNIGKKSKLAIFSLENNDWSIDRCSSILLSLTVTRIIDQFGRKRCHKKRKYVDVHQVWAGKNSFSAYICYTLDVLFWWAV